MVPPGAPLTYFNDGGGGPTEVHILYPKKSQLQDLSTQKIPTFFSIPKKIPQCFCIGKFYYLSSGKLKHANFNFGFGQKQNYKLHLCYFWFELMKNTIPKKIPLSFSRPKKIPASFIDPKKSLLAKMSDPKKSFGPPPPVIKICEWDPWGGTTSGLEWTWCQTQKFSNSINAVYIISNTGTLNVHELFWMLQCNRINNLLF